MLEDVHLQSADSYSVMISSWKPGRRLLRFRVKVAITSMPQQSIHVMGAPRQFTAVIFAHGSSSGNSAVHSLPQHRSMGQ
jgi:hypothetical protein